MALEPSDESDQRFGRDQVNAALSSLAHSDESDEAAKRKTRRWWRTPLQVLLIGLALVLAITGYVYQTLDQTPEFYDLALQVSPTANAEAGDEFESQAIRLQNSLRTTDKRWQAVFTQSQINGWLASDLIEKFPETLPPNIADPRVSFSKGEAIEGHAKVAFRYRSARLSATVVGAVEVFCTEQPDQIAVKINSLSAGLLPIPVSRVSHRLDDAMQRIGITVEWTEEESVPVALLNFPPDLVRVEGRQVRIDGLLIRDGELIVQGFVEPTTVGTE